MDTEAEIRMILEMVETRITNDYKVLDGDHDTVFIKSRKTGTKFMIHVEDVAE